MRPTKSVLVLAFVLVSVPLTGCIGNDSPDVGDGNDAEAQSIDEGDVAVPEGAKLQEIEDGYRLIWSDVETPVERSIEVPAGATMVDATAELPGETRAHVNVTNAETELSRCGTAQIDAFDRQAGGTVSCTGLTALDELPAEWTLTVEANASVADEVRLDLLSIPLDGPVSDLALDELSQPVHDVRPAEAVSISSHDGISLSAQVHLPDVDERVPTILVSDVASAQAPTGGAPTLESAVQTEAFAREMAMRGYAVVTADVRGTGQSGGCLDAWGPLEQADQGVLVEWIAEQDWSAGAIGTYGVGYSASTSLEAAVEAPDQVETAVAFGAVTDAYRDWHFGGVPNGEGTGDPLGGQLAGALAYSGADDKLSRLQGSGGGCDGSSFTAATDPRAVYDAFYEARNLTSMAEKVEAPVLYAQGLFDQVAKPSMADHLTSKLPADSFSMVGPWADGLPSRPDTRVLTLAWMDQQLKGKAVGLERLPSTSVANADGLHHIPDAWPPADAPVQTLYPNFDAGELQDTAAEGSASILLDPVGVSGTAEQGEDGTLVRLEGEVAETTVVSGRPAVDLAVTLQGLGNAFVSAHLYEDDGDGARELVTFGMANLAHRQGHGQFVPVQPGQLVDMKLPMQPTERVLEEGDTLVLEIRSSTVDDWLLVQPGNPGQLTVEGGADGTALALPVQPTDGLAAAPATVAG